MLALPLSPTSAVALRRRTLAPSFTPMSPISSPPPSPSPGLSSDDGEGGLGSKFGSATSSSDRLPTPASSSKALATNLPLRPSVSRKISYTRHSPDLSSSSATSSPIPAPAPAPTPPPPPSSFRLSMASEPPIGRPALFHLGCPESDDDEDDDDDGADDEFHDATSDGHVATVPLHPSPPLPPPKRKVNSNSSRYYTLLELLHTEARYLFDLRVLVNIYFELLPSLQLSTPKLSPSVSSHFLPRSVATSGSAPPSPSKASAAIAADTAARDPRAHARAHSSSSVVGKEPKPKLPPPSLLSSGDIDAIRRNGRQLLDFHTAFLDRLRAIVTDARFRIALNDDGPEDSWDWDTIPKWQDSWEPVLNETIVAVTTLFTTQASLFTVYEPFCSRQLEANEIIGRIARRRKDVWDLYERRCAELLALDRSHRRRRSESRIVAGRTNGDVPSRGRRHSFGAALLSSPVLPEPEAPRRPTSPAKQGEPTPTSATATPAPKDAGARLKLADYLVKPMQRVTRYPLLLAGLLIHPLPSAAQLSSSQPFASSAVDLACSDVVVASARLAMDHVAAQVDAAASAQAAYVQSARIAARLAPAPAVKLASFVSNLGPCTLAGPLDVVHHRALRDLGSGSVRAKYLAAFLYTGGFLVLAKVHGARRYEPRHWFDLAGFEVDGMEDGGLLPWSIRLYGPGAEFELACACVAEKRVWMRALRDAAAAQPAWNPGEAPSSIVAPLSLSATESHSTEPMPVVAPELPHITPASPFPELVNPFEHAQTMMFQSPTLSSFPISPTSATASHFSPTDVQSLSLAPAPILCDSTSPPGTVSSCSEAHAPLPPPPSRKSSRPKLGREPPRASISSRRSSTASVKAFFSAAPDRAVMVSRATALARQEVDDALRDVLSGVIADARGRAGVAGLFDSLDRQQVVRGEAGVGVVGAIGVAARNRLRKRESLLVRRATTSSDGPLATPAVPPVPRLTVATDRPSLVFGGSDEQLVLSPDPESQSHSNSHSHSHSRSSSVLPALPPPPPPKIDVEFSPSEIYKEPVALLDPSYLLPSGQDTEDTLRGRVHRSRSMVDNVRGFFSSSGLSVAERDRGPTRSASILLQQGGGTVSVRRRVTDSLRASRPPRRSAESASEHGSSKGMLRSLFSPFVRSSTAPAGS